MVAEEAAVYLCTFTMYFDSDTGGFATQCQLVINGKYDLGVPVPRVHQGVPGVPAAVDLPASYQFTKLIELPAGTHNICVLVIPTGGDTIDLFDCELSVVAVSKIRGIDQA